MFTKNYSTEESCEMLLIKSRNEIIDEGLHFGHVLKSLYKMWVKKWLSATKIDKTLLLQEQKMRCSR